MFDVYGLSEDMFERLIIRSEGPFPPQIKKTDWEFLGHSQDVPDHFLFDIESEGFSRYRSRLQHTKSDPVGAEVAYVAAR